MSRFQNIVFIVVFSVICCAVLVNIAWSNIAEPGDEPVNSALEGRTLESIPMLAVDTIQSGEYQSNMEQALADKIPLRDGVLLANARVQRSLIRVANAPYGFPAYPTFFGSGYVFCPGVQSVYQVPASRALYDEAFFDSVGAAVNKLVSAHPDFNWVYVLPDRANISLTSPAHDLVSNSIDYPFAISELKRVLPASCKVVECSYNSLEEYGRKFFKTDHHMQIDGAVDFYEAVVSSLGKEPAWFGTSEKVADDAFYGANSRTGLYDSVSDELRDVHYDPQGLTVKINGEEAELTRLNNSMDPDVAGSYAKKERFGNVYGEWFTWDYPVIEISNADPAVAGESLLLLGDSFDNNQMFLYAANYEHVYSVDPRYYEGDLEELISSHPDITDAAITISLDNLTSFFSRDDLS